MSNKKFYKDYNFWINLISTITLVIGILIALGVFSSPKINVYIGGVYLSPDSKTYNLNFIVPLTIENNGEKGAYIEKMFLAIRDFKADDQYSLYPDYEIDPKQYTTIACLNSSIIEGLYVPISLAPKEVKTKYFLFMQRSKKYLSVGNYSLSIYIKTNNDKDYVLKDYLNFSINDYEAMEYNDERAISITRDGLKGISEPRCQ